MLLAKSKTELQNLVNKFNNICERRLLKVNASKSKVAVFERHGESEYDITLIEKI